MHSGNLEEILYLLIAAVFIVALFKYLRLSPVLGFLVAGVAIGPYGLSIISDIEETSYIAEFGIIFLLFYIGLEFTFERLISMRTFMFGFGSLQILITAVLIGWVAYLANVGAAAAIIIGGGLALSSTAIVLQVLSERNEYTTKVARLAIAVLILQDLVVIPLLVLVPLLAQEDSNIISALLNALIRATIALAGIIIVGRLFIRPLFQIISGLKSRELFTAATLLILLGTAWLTEHFGLSLALGAFLAGLMIAETEFYHQVEADIQPFKGLLMGLFFMTVGMQIDFHLLGEKLWVICLLSLGIILLKAFVIIILCDVFKIRWGPSVYAGLLLCQGGEFAFILFSLAFEQGLMEKELAQILMVSVTLTMAFTPLLATLGRRISEKMAVRAFGITNLDELMDETTDLDHHVIVAGFGRMGRTICRLLGEKRINYIALDTNPKHVDYGRKNGFPVYYGDATRIDVLNSVGTKRAEAAIVTFGNKREAKKAVTAIRKLFPDVPIIARAWDRDFIKELEAAGATVALAEAFEVSLQLGAETLKTLGVPDFEIDRVVGQLRAEDYAMAQEHLNYAKRIKRYIKDS